MPPLKAKSKAKPGRPKIKISAQSVETLAALGLTTAEIAGALTKQYRFPKLITDQTIEANFYPSLVKGKMTLHLGLKSTLCKMAMAGNVPALIFALKAYCGLSDYPKDAIIQNNNGLSITINLSDAKDIEAKSSESLERVKALFAEYRPAIEINGANSHADAERTT